jgi:hypothetical protein
LFKFPKVKGHSKWEELKNTELCLFPDRSVNSQRIF